jgi:NNP family nitrate/nitrite transporter-like MFS transporter
MCLKVACTQLKKIKKSQKPTTLSFKWEVVASLAVISFVMAFGGAFAALVPLVMDNLHITYTQAGYMGTLNRLPSILLPIFMGILVGRYGAKHIGIISIILEIMGCLISANAPSYLVLLFGLFTAGAGFAIRNTIFPTMITQLFSPSQLGKAMGVYTSASISTMVVYPLVSAVGLSCGWRMCFYLGGIMDVAALIIFWCTTGYGSSSRFYSEMNQRNTKSVWSALLNGELCKIGIFRTLEIVGTTSFLVWAPTFVVESYGVNLVYASSIPSLFILVCMIFAPFAGSISDRFWERKYFLLVGCSLWSLLLVLIPLAPTLELLFPLIIASGMSASFIPVLTSTLISQVADPSLSGVGFGVQAVSMGVGGIISAPLVGYIRDSTGSWLTSFAYASLFLAAAAIIAITLKNKGN